jgi:hypothetical protein
MTGFKGQGAAGVWMGLLVAFLVMVGVVVPAQGQLVAAVSMRNLEDEEIEEARVEEGESFLRTEPPVIGFHPDMDAAEVAAQAFEPKSFWDGWKGSVQAGVNGASGNSENFNLRMGFDAQRVTSAMETKINAAYSWSTDDGTKTASRGDLGLRNDWNLGESPWFVFAIGKVEYDEFQDWRWRTSTIVGPGYTVIRDEKTTLKVRGGIGASKEFGGTQNELVPELDIGFDFERQLTERQKVFVTHDTSPSIEDLSDFRMVTKAGWEILVDPEVNLLLKLGVEHRRQSKPGEGFKKDDIDYFAVLGWNF